MEQKGDNQSHKTSIQLYWLGSMSLSRKISVMQLRICRTSLHTAQELVQLDLVAILKQLPPEEVFMPSDHINARVNIFTEQCKDEVGELVPTVVFNAKPV